MCVVEIADYVLSVGENRRSIYYCVFLSVTVLF
jgi:hypothetical protein